MPFLKENFPSILSPVNTLKRSLEMHQLPLSPWLKIKVLLKMVMNFFKINLKIYLIVNTATFLNLTIWSWNIKKNSLFHLNIYSLTYPFQDLNQLLKSPKNNFSIIGTTDSRLKVNSQPLTNIELNNYNIESTPTESKKGGKLLCISSDLNYKVRKDLKIYKAKEQESVFVEIINKDKRIIL